MSAYAVDVGEKSFEERLTPVQTEGLALACKARGAEIDWQRGVLTVRGRYLNGLCADLHLPPGLHLTRAGLTAPSPSGTTAFRIEIL